MKEFISRLGVNCGTSFLFEIDVVLTFKTGHYAMQRFALGNTEFLRLAGNFSQELKGTEMIKTGQKIRVNSTKGLVEILRG